MFLVITHILVIMLHVTGCLLGVGLALALTLFCLCPCLVTLSAVEGAPSYVSNAPFDCAQGDRGKGLRTTRQGAKDTRHGTKGNKAMD